MKQVPLVSVVAGSSPRVRGKLEPPEGEASISGLIPACAGKTAVGSETLAAMRAHPRVCGENLMIVRF